MISQLRKKIIARIEKGVFLGEERQVKVRLPQKERGEIFGRVESMLAQIES
jgi:hypothetical protein